jgi:hypothetical protein
MYRTSTIRQHLLIGLVDETSDDLAQPTPQGGTMKALRSTIYMSPSEAKTMFVREDALAAPISDTTTAEVEVPGAFVISEVFEIDASIDMSALAKIAQQKLRVRARREQDQATLYYWDMHALAHVRADGVLTATEPAPLSVDEIKVVLRQIAKHPMYEGQIVMAISEDLKIVRMKAGKVEVEEMKA